MKKNAVVVAVLAVVLLLAVVYLWGPSSVPRGQQPLTVLSNADLREFAAAFDNDADVPRIVLLLSPT
jgi:hypothetical protein